MIISQLSFPTWAGTLRSELRSRVDDPLTDLLPVSLGVLIFCFGSLSKPVQCRKRTAAEAAASSLQNGKAGVAARTPADGTIVATLHHEDYGWVFMVDSELDCARNDRSTLFEVQGKKLPQRGGRKLRVGAGHNWEAQNFRLRSASIKLKSTPWPCMPAE